MEIPVYGRAERRGYLCPVLSAVSCINGYTGNDYGIIGRTRQQEKRGPLIQGFGKKGNQMAYTRLVLHSRMLPSHDVLHDGFGMDAFVCVEVSDREV